MTERDERARRAWTIHGVAVALWVILYLFVCWDALFPEKKPALDLAGFGAVLLGFTLGIFVMVSTLVMVFAGRRPAVPIVMHALVFALWAGGSYVEQEDRRAREEALAREQAQRERERQPDGCLHVRRLQVRDGKPRRAEATLANACDEGVVVDRVTLVGFDRAGGNDILSRSGEGPVAVPRGQTATIEIEGGSIQGGDPTIPLSRWAWKVHVDVSTPRSAMLCFATPGAPEASRCGEISAVSAVP